MRLTTPLPAASRASVQNRSEVTSRPQRLAADETTSNFTPRAQQVLAHARTEADRLNHNFVGTEHLLLGLIKLGLGVAVNVLLKMGLDLETVRIEVEKQVGVGPDQKLIGHPPYTPRVKKVLALAAKESKALNHSYVGTEHILLGLLREGDGVASRVLKCLGVDMEQTREEVLKELDPNRDSSAEARGAATPNQGTPAQSASLQPLGDQVDTSKRYDIYCTDWSHEVVVYRNALFKGTRHLFERSEYDFFSEYIELEQPDGQTIFVSRSSVIKFCEHGTAADGESASGGSV